MTDETEEAPEVLKLTKDGRTQQGKTFTRMVQVYFKMDYGRFKRGTVDLVHPRKVNPLIRKHVCVLYTDKYKGLIEKANADHAKVLEARAKKHAAAGAKS